MLAPVPHEATLHHLRACANRGLAVVGDLTDWLIEAGFTPLLSPSLFAYWS